MYFWRDSILIKGYPYQWTISLCTIMYHIYMWTFRSSTMEEQFYNKNVFLLPRVLQSHSATKHSSEPTKRGQLCQDRQVIRWETNRENIRALSHFKKSIFVLRVVGRLIKPNIQEKNVDGRVGEVYLDNIRWKNSIQTLRRDVQLTFLQRDRKCTEDDIYESSFCNSW